VKVRAIEKPPSVHLLKGITPMGGNPEGKRFSEGRFPIQDEIPRKRCLLSEETSTSGVSLNRKQFQESEILNRTILLDGDPLEGGVDLDKLEGWTGSNSCFDRKLLMKYSPDRDPRRMDLPKYPTYWLGSNSPPLLRIHWRPKSNVEPPPEREVPSNESWV
jgi:hypothetical protein